VVIEVFQVEDITLVEERKVFIIIGDNKLQVLDFNYYI
jgi:hypothetical protein